MLINILLVAGVAALLAWMVREERARRRAEASLVRAIESLIQETDRLLALPLDPTRPS